MLGKGKYIGVMNRLFAAMVLIVAAAILVFGVAGCGELPATDSGGGEVKNVILCIGDGMGFGQVALGRISSVGAGGRLNMEQMPEKSIF